MSVSSLALHRPVFGFNPTHISNIKEDNFFAKLDYLWAHIQDFFYGTDQAKAFDLLKTALKDEGIGGASAIGRLRAMLPDTCAVKAEIAREGASLSFRLLCDGSAVHTIAVPVDKLEGADLQGVNLSGVDLSKAILRNARMQWADLTDANLTEANLTGAHLRRAVLTTATLTRAQLGSTIFDIASLASLVARNNDLTEVELKDVTGFLSDLLGNQSTLEKTIFEGLILKAQKQGAKPRKFDIDSGSWCTEFTIRV